VIVPAKIGLTCKQGLPASKKIVEEMRLLSVSLELSLARYNKPKTKRNHHSYVGSFVIPKEVIIAYSFVMF